MTYLNTTLQKPTAWKAMLQDNARLVEVSLLEMEQLLHLARRAPGLNKYEKALQKLSIFFTKAFQFYRENAPGELSSLVSLWERYSAAVLQRFTGIMGVELRAADFVVANIFARFLKQVPTEYIAYAPDVVPLVYGGEGGLSAYFTHPPDLDRPFALINLPHAAFCNVWQWLALPHEIGHDLYATVRGLEHELEEALAKRMREAVTSGEIKVPAVDLNLAQFGVPHAIKYAPEDFLAALWKGWANESQGDMMGLINCGGATIVALQQIIGFDTAGEWLAGPGDNGKLVDYPEPHPTSYVRNALNIAGLRMLSPGHNKFADEIESRFKALCPSDDAVSFSFAGTTIELTKVKITELVKSAHIAAEVILKHPLKVLGGKSYSQLATFTDEDQTKVDSLVEPLCKGDPSFAQGEGIEARHALAATVLAFERDRTRADVINRCFKHFLVV